MTYLNTCKYGYVESIKNLHKITQLEYAYYEERRKEKEKNQPKQDT